MIQILHYNKISDKLRESIPQLTSAGIRYELLNISQSKDRAIGFNIPFVKNVPFEDVIIDPFTGHIVTIAAIKGQTPDQKPIFASEELKFGRINAQTPYWKELRPNNPTDVIIHEYLWLTNFVQDNPHRNPTKTAIIRRYNPTQDALMKKAARATLIAALAKVNTMTDNQIREFALSRNIVSSTDVDVLREMIAELATKDPNAFIVFQSDSLNSVKAVINRALDQGGILRKDRKKNCWVEVSTGNILVQYNRNYTHDEAVSALCQFLLSSDTSKALLKEIEDRVSSDFTTPEKAE